LKFSRTPVGKIWTSVSKYGLREGLRDAAARWARSRLSVPYDVTRDYEWVLAQDNSAKLLAPRTGPLKINWLLPAIGKGSGGLLNIFRAVHNLEKWGHENRVYVLADAGLSGTEAQKLVRDFYFPIEAPIQVFDGKVADSDALVATSWTTAYAARGVANTARKFYFVQDLEDRFYPEGSLSEFAKETYRWGFHGITLGHWIADVLQREYGMPCSPFGFSYDRELYSRNGDGHVRERRKRVLFYARPQTERRGFELGLLALSLVAKRMPEVEFVLVGFPPRRMRIPFHALLPGVLSPSELAELYRRCDVALVLSHTNLSMLPLELMASGCAVVSNRAPNVEWLLTEETAQLASPTPQSISEAVLTLLDNEDVHARKVAAGLAFARETDWVSEIKKIESALCRGLDIL
jgi:glycosyltransferase involved in cell wall biosynthesis